MSDDTLGRRCAKCGDWKEAARFVRDKQTGRLKSYCNRCCNVGRKRHTEQSAIRGRARHRALTLLSHQFPVEFAELLRVARAECKTEAATLASRYDGPEAFPRLAGGVRERGQTALDRLDVGRCPHCINNHDTDHVCRYCGGTPDESPLVLPIPVPRRNHFRVRTG